MTTMTNTFVDHLPSSVMRWISSHATEQVISADSVLVTEGGEGSDIYIVSSGAFDVLIGTDAGRAQKISELGPGAVIGEMSWLDGGPASATISARKDGVVLALDGQALEQKIADDPVFGSHFYRALAREAFLRLRAGNTLLGRA